MSFGEHRLLVVGDLIVDQYLIGKVRRISPEAPVPILNPERTETRPGGVGNTALNLISLGQKVRLFGRIGIDAPGQLLSAALEEEGIEVEFLQREEGWPTPVKTRLIAGGQQMLRIDTEQTTPFACPHLDLRELLEDVEAIAISDYAKGFCTPLLLQTLIQEAKKRSIPVIVDPKGRDYLRYSGSTILKPNLIELTEAAKLGAEASLDELAAALRAQVQFDSLLVTKSELGISLFSDKGREDFPAQVRQVRDVTGAGDTVLAVIAAACAAQMPLPEAAQLANCAAGLAIERFGCARISAAELFAAKEPAFA
ncbi:MAG: bifunctional hydroxymethylpyrimidine kinase/phosphomethylpyrimidine kinase [Verrucomicrobia bacterium]|nr:bifunctional hydroxymethylpyrimidine kinase/phosphomethylpyrimidine kinase [Verrucomicrobiota bacterium]